MENNCLTTKEVTLLSDLLIYEESACKKAKLYSKTLTNKKLAQEFSSMSKEHKENFNLLLGLL